MSILFSVIIFVVAFGLGFPVGMSFRKHLEEEREQQLRKEKRIVDLKRESTRLLDENEELKKSLTLLKGEVEDGDE